MKTILLTVILTLLIHSLIGTVIYTITNENETFAGYYGFGIVGCVLAFICLVIRRINKWWKYRDKRSIFEDENGNKYYCKVKYANDFNWHYDMVKRYATKDEWKDLEPFTEEQIENVQKHCDRCKHNDDCTFDMYRASLDRIRCKHDIFGQVTEFDKFERSELWKNILK